MQFEDVYEDYRLACRARGVNRKTWRWYSQHLREFGAFLKRDLSLTDVTAIQPRHVNLFIEHLQMTPGLNGRGNRSSATVRGYVQSVRVFLSYLVLEDLIEEKVRNRVSMPKASKKVVKTINRDQFDRMMEATSREISHELAVRDRAILSLLLDTGMRADELCTLAPSDLHFADDYVLVRGKGDKEREIGPIGVATQRAVRQYMRLRKPGETLFLGRRREMLTPSGLDRMMYRLRDWAGKQHFAGVRISAHTFRHTFAVTFLRQGGDLKRLQLLMGHTSLAVTQRYLEDFQQKDARNGRSVLDEF